MAALDKLKRRFKEYKPTVVSTFVVYVTARPSPVDEVDDEFQIVEVHDSNDPLLPKMASGHGLKVAKRLLDEGSLDVIVALKDGEPIGRIWENNKTITKVFDGIPRFKLAADEFFMYDLFVEREYRRSSVAQTMADHFFRKYPPETTNLKFGYGFVAYENAPSILWHHSVGFQIAQTVNMLHIGPNIKWKIPFSDMPRFGPLSRNGRHKDPSKPVFGPPLFP